jgi:hypothetical protein
MDTFAPESREYAKEWRLPARKYKGWVHEVEVSLRHGDAIAYESESDGHGSGGPVEFNIHSHEGREVTYHAKRRDARAEGTFVAPWDGKFYLMWENASDVPVLVRARLRRQG